MRVVVAGAVLRDGRLLAARRSAPPELAGRWELPGGKVEPGESEEEALVRELREELGIHVVPLRRIPGEWPLRPGLLLRAWTARLLSGVPQPLQDHDQLRWLTPDSLGTVPWLDQDRPAVAWAAARLGVAAPAD
jgi:8-oxo-dGTP diphosphatase